MLYANYGPLSTSLMGKRYSFAPPPTTAIANAFVLDNGTFIFPVVLANHSQHRVSQADSGRKSSVPEPPAGRLAG